MIAWLARIWRNLVEAFEPPTHWQPGDGAVCINRQLRAPGGILAAQIPTGPTYGRVLTVVGVTRGSGWDLFLTFSEFPDRAYAADNFARLPKGDA